MSELTIGLIGGTGLGQALMAAHDGKRHEVETPFGRPSDAIIETEWAGVRVLILSRHGAGHLLNPSQVPFRANIFALKQLGVTHILASGAVGSLREEFRPRDLVIPDQVIDKTFRRAGTFYEGAAVHVEFAEPFCPVLRRMLIEAGEVGSGFRVQGLDKKLEARSEKREESGDKKLEVRSEKREESKTHDPNTASPEPSTLNPEPFSVHSRGCYVCMEGPAFSSRAESVMHRLWGGDLIGMTAMPEAKLAKEAEISYALIALVTDYDCWRNKPVNSTPGQAGGAAAAGSAGGGGGAADKAPDAHELLKEIIGNVQIATENAVSLIKRTVERMAGRRDELAKTPAQRALELAIWSDKSRIDPAEVQRLGPLWMKYFGDTRV